MTNERAADKIFALFIFLPFMGVTQFVMANTVGLKASVVAGSVGLAGWFVALVFTVFRGGILSGFPRWFAAVFGLFAIWVFWITSLPPYFRDDLIIHLELPKTILRAGSWVSIPFQPSSVFPNILAPINLVLVNAGLERAVSVIPALFYLASALLLARWAAAEYGAGWGVFSACAILLEPIFFRLSTTAYNDPAVMFLSCAGSYYFWKYFRDGRGTDGYKGAVAFAAGSAIKYNAGLLLVTTLVILFADSLRTRTFGPRIRVFLVSVLAVGLFCGPWWVRFAHEHPSAPTYFLKGPMQERVLFCGESFAYALASPVRLFFEGEEGKMCAYDGGLNPFLLIFGVFCLPVVGAATDKRFLLASAALFMATASLLFPITGRYFLPVAPTLVFLSAGFLFAASKWRNLAAVALASALLVFSAQGYARAAWRFNGWDFLLGRESQNAFLAKNIAGYGATMFANQRLAQNSVVYYVFLGNQVYYSSVPYYYDSYWDGATFIRLFKPEADNDYAYRELGTRNITHVIYNKKMMDNFLARSGTREKFSAFKERYATTLYGDNGAELLELVKQRP
jgi:hypothetical protein